MHSVDLRVKWIRPSSGSHASEKVKVLLSYFKCNKMQIIATSGEAHSFNVKTIKTNLNERRAKARSLTLVPVFREIPFHRMQDI